MQAIHEQPMSTQFTMSSMEKNGKPLEYHNYVHYQSQAPVAKDASQDQSDQKPKTSETSLTQSSSPPSHHNKVSLPPIHTLPYLHESYRHQAYPPPPAYYSAGYRVHEPSYSQYVQYKSPSYTSSMAHHAYASPHSASPVASPSPSRYGEHGSKHSYPSNGGHAPTPTSAEYSHAYPLMASGSSYDSVDTPYSGGRRSSITSPTYWATHNAPPPPSHATARERSVSDSAVSLISPPLTASAAPGYPEHTYQDHRYPVPGEIKSRRHSVSGSYASDYHPYHVYSARHPVYPPHPQANHIQEEINSPAPCSAMGDQSRFTPYPAPTRSSKENISLPSTPSSAVSPGSCYDGSKQCFNDDASSRSATPQRSPTSSSSPGKTFECESCGKTMKRLCDYRSHIKIHIPNLEKPFACEKCSIRFLRKHDLTRHLRIHAGTKPFSCANCGKGFVRKDALRRHQSMDESMRKYRCVPRSEQNDKEEEEAASPRDATVVCE